MTCRGSPAADQAAAGALKHIIPLVQPAEVGDSWEEVLEDERLGSTSGRLMQLQCLVWPAIPLKLQQHLAQRCPRLLVNLALVMPVEKVRGCTIGL